MLNRQKAVLLFLRHASHAVSSIRLMKWSFLLANETPSHGGATFYAFVPYKYGPYSFTLDQEKDALVRDGLVKIIDQKRLCLTAAGRQIELKLAENVSQDLCYITQTYGSCSDQALIDLVYEKYPWYTINSQLPEKRNMVRPVVDCAIYTMGYEGLTADAFLNRLLEAGIQRIIDVRYNPVSRRYGFHKTTLARLATRLGMDYIHVPELGIPGTERIQLRSLTQYEKLFRAYESGLQQLVECQNTVGNLLKEKPSVLICMEANPQFCHRNVLAQVLTQIVNLPVNHLGWPR
ncbi:DUF488 domain-containing protein [Candidatus Viridilinea mediisalina]|uniref:DUF488 domain-containing protein n=1 Tax=Candidatus Viridilinea mediisalina TaxID=2024553 RepID=A0A2A6RJ70_9CHLR|nr:DUF488 domain-containing protein [Candidatus Viridilinea mediisalina]PDW02935.1 hypothetical protein CJ255_11465 [Candidatus Viridilinea mediisalina]